jgi:hypothetical protein
MFASKNELFTRPSGGYTIARSVRFRGSATSYFNRTWGTPTNNQIWTFSCWAKLGDQTNYRMQLLSSGITGSPTDYAQFQFIGGLNYQETISSATALGVTTSAVFRDPAAWYHVVLAVDTTQATATNRVKIYVNGILQTVTISTQVAQNTNTTINKSTRLGGIGALAYNGSYINNSDGYQTECYFIDGQQLTPSSFGETDSITGVWKPKKYSGTYGTNGFYLNFSDNSNNTAATIGKDYSGNGNNWTPNNISVTAGVTYDSMQDVPTLTSATAANYAVLNPLLSINGAATTFSNGNLQIATASGSNSLGVSTIPTSSGKWYFEATQTASGDATFGIWQPFSSTTLFYSSPNNNYRWYGGNGNVYDGAGNVAQTYSTYTNGDVLGIALDLDNGKVYYSKNNVYQGSSNPVTGTNPVASGLTGTWLFGCNTGGTGATFNANFGQRPFSYTPPTGFVALNTYNLPASTIKNGGLYMKPVLYTGDGTTNKSITGVGFQTDFNWTKSRSSASYSHQLSDSVRGFSKYLYSNATNAEGTDATNHIQSVNSDGYVINSGASFNASGVTYVAWNWKAGGTAVTNTNGSITSTVSVGATQGFSVVTYTGTGANATVGHGLGVAPSMYIVKRRTGGVGNWAVWHTGLSNTTTSYILLDSTSAQSTSSSLWGSTAATSTTLGIGTSVTTNNSTDTYVAYCFSAVAGYSAFGSYTGNGSTDGPFVYTGFRPRWVMVKDATTAGGYWEIHDTSRSTYNATTARLFPNDSSAELTGADIDFLSNGFKVRTTDGTVNNSGSTIVYVAFAENPFKNSLAR